MKRLSWWRWRALEVAAAVGIFASVIYISEAQRQRSRFNVPAENWFVVNQIYVPDHARGSNPEMTYDRSIKEPFQGFWVVEVQRLIPDGRFVLECSGSGVSDYELQDYIPNNTVTWDWFVGGCKDVDPGTYRLRASWKMKRASWPEKDVVAYSNNFVIR